MDNTVDNLEGIKPDDKFLPKAVKDMFSKEETSLIKEFPKEKKKKIKLTAGKGTGKFFSTRGKTSGRYNKEHPSYNEEIKAVRRRKVRELTDMGYNIDEIVRILSGGILLENKKHYFKNLSTSIVASDISYIQADELAIDKTFEEKKGAILSKYNFLYRKVVKLAMEKDQTSKASLFSVAKTILDKVAEIEGIIGTDKAAIELLELRAPSKIAEDLNSLLTSEDKDAINSKINEILAKCDARGN